jgi:DMSO reductase anchor subunit
MFAYVLVLLGVLSRYVVASHLPWLNFTAVGGSLLFFGARRSWREMFFPLAALMASDFCLTTYVYHYPFRWQGYVTTWAWYLMAMVLGQILLHAKTNFVRGAAGAILGPTSFFLVSNYGVWASGFNGYPHTLAGLITCYAAGLPFYRNDLISTSLVLAAAFGVEALLRRSREERAAPALAAK